jgi:hypothetical protein
MWYFLFSSFYYMVFLVLFIVSCGISCSLHFIMWYFLFCSLCHLVFLVLSILLYGISCFVHCVMWYFLFCPFYHVVFLVLFILSCGIINILPLIEGVMVDYYTQKTNITRDEVEGDIVVF